MDSFKVNIEDLSAMKDALAATKEDFNALTEKDYSKVIKKTQNTIEDYIASAQKVLLRREQEYILAQREYERSQRAEGENDDAAADAYSMLQRKRELLDIARNCFDELSGLPEQYNTLVMDFFARLRSEKNNYALFVDRKNDALQKYIDGWHRYSTPATGMVYRGRKLTAELPKKSNDNAVKTDAEVLSPEAKKVVSIVSDNGSGECTSVPRGAEKMALVPLFSESDSTGKSFRNEKLADDTGRCIMLNGSIAQNSTFSMHGNTYKTDSFGRITSVFAIPRFTPDNPRNVSVQLRVGGFFRLTKDQGGHLVARILNGDARLPNVVALDKRLNQSDYANMEKLIAGRLQENEKVSMSISLTYPDTVSTRPSLIFVKVSGRGGTDEYIFDNEFRNTNMNYVPNKDRAIIADFIVQHAGILSSAVIHRDLNDNEISREFTVTYSENNKNKRKLFCLTE